MSRLSESDLMNDSKYRQYAGNVEKVLKTFEATNEWADLIAALTKLYKIIHNNSKFGEIPKAVGVSKRLSQCMHPALPFGVHLKTIECYKQIFDTLGTKNLSSDIHLYSVGLLPLLPNATINVKKALLELYENYFLPIGPDLKPALTGFLNGILPALEEGSEFFERILNFVCQLESCVGPAYFFSCLWYCVINNGNTRSPGLFYASYSLEKKKCAGKFDHWSKLEPNLTIRALIECCSPNLDSSSTTNVNLIQRQLLDFLLQFLPLDILENFGAENLDTVENFGAKNLDTVKDLACCSFTEEHYKILVRAASFVLLRRDQSLNRRYFAWLFGVTKENLDQLELINQRRNYFQKFSRRFLIESFLELLKSAKIDYLIKICRLMTNFLDRQELKESILDGELFLEFLARIRKMTVTNTPKFDELIKALNLLSSYQKNHFLWSFLAGKFAKILRNDVANLAEICDLMDFFLNFNNQMPHLIIDTENLSKILYEIFDFSNSTMGNYTILLKLSMKLLTNDENEGSKVQNFGLQFFGRLTEILDHDENFQFVEVLCHFLRYLFDYLPIYNPTNDETWLDNLQNLCKSSNLHISVNFTQILLYIATEKYPNLLYTEQEFFFDLTRKFWDRILCDFDSNADRDYQNLFKFRENCCQILFALHSKFEFVEKMIVEGMTSSNEVCQNLQFYKVTACLIMLTDFQDLGENNNNRNLLLAENSLLKFRWFENCSEFGELLPKVFNFLIRKLSHRKTWRFAIDCRSAFSSIAINAYSTLYKFNVKNCDDRPSSAVYHFTGSSDWWSFVRNNHVFNLRDSDWSEKTIQRRPLSSASSNSELDSVIRKILNGVLQRVESAVDESDDSALENSVAPPTLNFVDLSINDDRNAALFYYRFFDVDHVIFTLRTLQRCLKKIDNVKNFDQLIKGGRLINTSLIEQLINLKVDDLTEKSIIDQKKSIFGFLTEKKSRDQGNHTFLECILCSCCYFLRSLHLNNPMIDRPIDPNDVESNLCLKIASIDLSIDIFRSINLKILQQQRRRQQEFSTTIKSVKRALKKCKVQKTILRCLRSTLRDLKKNDDYANGNITDLIAHFNWNLHPQPNLALRTLQHSLLQILEKILEFEFSVQILLFDEDHQNRSINFLTPVNQTTERCLIYEQDLILEEDNLLEECLEDDDEEEEDYSTVQCKLFRSIIDNCLQSRNFYSHGDFLKFFYNILPYAQDFLPFLVQSACKRIRYNLELCFSQRIQNSQDPFPPDYGVDLLKYLCLIGHFCLTIELNGSTAAATPIDAMSTNQIRAMSLFSNISTGTSGSFSTNQNRPNNFLNTASSVILNPSDIFTNVFKAFNLTENSTNRSPNKKDESLLMNQHSFIMARQQIFGQLSELLSTLCDIRSFLKNSQKINTLGKHEDIVNLIANFVSPIALHYPRQFFWSIADVWASKSRKSKMSSLQENFYNIECKQDDVAEFVLSIECLSMEKIFDGASKILQHPLKSVTSIDKDTVPFELSLCELVYACSKILQQKSPLYNNNKKAITWSILQRFLQESLQSCQAPMSKLNLFKLFCDFVEEVKDEDQNSRKINYRKELQELCQQFLDCLLEIVSFQLAQPTWLKRTLILKETDHTSMMSSSSSFNELVAEIYDDKISGCGASTVTNSLSASLSVLTPAETPASGVVSGGGGSTKRDVLSSVCALNLMADRLPNLIDWIFKSDDKDKLQFLAEKLWSNGVYPFLKSHSRKNGQNFWACSRLLAKLSQFPLLRNIWRKSAIDLLCDQQFFFIDYNYQTTYVESWLIIVDNLMSQDRNSFREFLSRTSLSQSSGLFTSKEQEYDSRFLSLKRLSFVLLSSEVDQYQQYLADIQERITDNLKLSTNSLNVYAQVLICLRVLLIRLSPHHFAPFWPTLVAELVNVLTLIEQDGRFLGVSKSATSQDQKNVSRDEQSLNLYLCACKLLESLSCLPTEKMIQFQMYSWIFFPSISKSGRNLPVSSTSATYVDHSTQILNRFNIFCENPDGDKDDFIDAQFSSFLDQEIKYLTRFNDLKSFFKKLCSSNINTIDKEAIVKLVEKSILIDLFDNFL